MKPLPPLTREARLSIGGLFRGRQNGLVIAGDASHIVVEQLAESLFGPRPAAEVLLAFLGDEPAGFAVFFPIYSTFLGKRQLYLEDLLVRKAARGHGVGRAIMAALARIAQERGCHLLQWSVLKWNDPAIRFYRGLGATEHGGWDSYQLGGASLTRLAAEFAESVG